MEKGIFYINEANSKGEYLNQEAEFITKETTYKLKHGEMYELPKKIIDFINSCSYTTFKNNNFGDFPTISHIQRYTFVTEKD